MEIKERIGLLRKAAFEKSLGLGRNTEFLESITYLNVLSPAQEAKLAGLERTVKESK